MAQVDFVAGDVLGETVLGFSRDRIFCQDEEVASSLVGDRTALAVAHKILATASSDLHVRIGISIHALALWLDIDISEITDASQAEIYGISQEHGDDADTWIEQARALQRDIDKSRALANEVVREAEAEVGLQETIKDKEILRRTLHSDVVYRSQTFNALNNIKEIKIKLDMVEETGVEAQIIESLDLLNSERTKSHWMFA